MPPGFYQALLGWYRESRADLPWRKAPTPYHVWLSEVMLQQTQVETVIPYYERFLRAFPTIEALARASLDDVLKQWEGLGYYSRARGLHQAAGIIVAEYGGRLPADVESLRSLPGIGPYTAGAIASIAFGIAAPLVDGNVTRLFTRLLDLDADINLSATRKQLWSIAADWLPQDQPGDYNQALMEIGRQICKPRKPQCQACPLRVYCRSFAAGTVAQRPVRSRRAPIPHYDVAAGLIRDGQDRLLIARRPLEGLLGGLWEFPGGKREADENLADCLRRELREELAIEVEVGALLAQVEHAFTHFKITLYAFECRYLGALPPYDEPQAIAALDWAWVDEAQLGDYSFGKADRVVIAELKRRRELLL